MALPPLARTALDRYLVERGLPVTSARWEPGSPLIGSLGQDPASGITGTRLWGVMRRFITQVADLIQADSPVAAEKLRHASPHWMRRGIRTRRMLWRAARN